jgi:hypothetical protein
MLCLGPAAHLPREPTRPSPPALIVRSAGQVHLRRLTFGATQVHAAFQTDRLLTHLDQARGQIRVLSAGAPRDVDEFRSKVAHPLNTVIQVLETLQSQETSGLWFVHAHLSSSRREELERPVGPALSLGLLEFLSDLHDALSLQIGGGGDSRSEPDRLGRMIYRSESAKPKERAARAVSCDFEMRSEEQTWARASMKTPFSRYKGEQQGSLERWIWKKLGLYETCYYGPMQDPVTGHHHGPLLRNSNQSRLISRSQVSQYRQYQSLTCHRRNDI